MATDLNVLFWNVDKKNLFNETIQLINKYDVTVLIIAEYTEDYILNLSNQLPNFKEVIHHQPQNKRLAIWVKDGTINMTLAFSDKDYGIYKISHPPTATELLLAGIHLFQPEMSKRNPTPYLTTFIENIVRQELDSNNCKTLIVGDFNIPPFHEALIATEVLNTTNSIEIAKTKYRMVDKKQYHYFYNPMWRLFGNQKTLGTFYYDNIDHLHWNMIDQVLIRPDLIDQFNEQKLEIITHFNDTTSLLRETTKYEQPIHRIDEINNSGHLPVFFSIHLS